MWKDKLKEVEERMKLFGDEINNGSSPNEINNFCAEVLKKFSITLPNEFSEFLSCINGIEFNGHIIYGIDKEYVTTKCNQSIVGLIDLNETWYDNKDLKKYLFLGESDMSWYVWMIETNTYLELDKPSGTIIKQYNKLEEMIATILESSL